MRGEYRIRGVLISKVPSTTITLSFINTEFIFFQIKIIDAQIRLQTKKVEAIQQEATLNISQEREMCKRKQKECVLKQCKMHQELKGIMRSLQDKTLDKEMLTVRFFFILFFTPSIWTIYYWYILSKVNK